MFGLKGILPSIRGCNFQERKCLLCPDQFFIPLCLDSGNFWPLIAVEQILPADIIGFEGFVHVTKYAGKMSNSG